MRRWLVAVAMVPAMMLMSCATIISGPNEDIRVTSTPSDARAILRCPLQVQDGVTPLNVSIPRRTGDCHLTVSKEGYAEQTLLVERGVNPAYWLNFFTIPLVLYAFLR